MSTTQIVSVTGSPQARVAVPDARALITATTPLVVASTTANVPIPAANPFAGRFTSAATPWLNGSPAGASETAWYLFGNVNDVAVMEMAFLNGVRNPTIESVDTDFNTLGIQMRGYHDFGVAMQDKRGGVKSKGAA